MKGFIAALGLIIVPVIAVLTAMMCLAGDAEGVTTYLPSPWVVTSDTVLSNGTFEANTSIEVQGATLTLEDAELVIGRGSDGWALWVDETAGLVARRSTMRGPDDYWTYSYLYGDVLLDNTTVSDFSTIVQNDGTMVLDHCTFDGNRYAIVSQSDLVIKSSRFVDTQYYSIEWGYSYDYAPSRLLVADSYFQSTGGASGISISGPGSDPVDVTAEVRGCTFVNLYRAISVQYFMRYGSVDIHDNFGDQCTYCLYVDMSEVVRVSHNQWAPSQSGCGIYVDDVYTHTTYVEITNETIVGGDRGISLYAYEETVVLRDMNITGCDMGIYSSGTHVDVCDSRICCERYDFSAVNEGTIHIVRCTHTRKGYAGYYSMVAEMCMLSIRRVTWQSGLPIDTGTTEITNETGFYLASWNNERPMPVEMPVWMVQYFGEVVVDTVRGCYTVRGVRFMSLPVSMMNLTEVSLVIIDDRPPMAGIFNPKAGDVLRVDALAVTGMCDDIGAGVFKVNARFADGPWARAAIDVGGMWSVELLDLPDDVGELRVRVSDYAGNVNDTVLLNITVDTRPPAIELVKPTGVVGSSPVTLVALTEPHSRAYVDELEVPVMDNGAFQATVELKEGENTLVLRVVDAVGNTVHRNVNITMDSKPPVLRIDSPADGAWVGASTVAVVGLVSEAVELSVGTDVRRVEAGMFQVSVGLRDEVTLLLITVQDAAGNYMRESRLVHLDRDRPGLAIGSPAAGDRVRTASITVRGAVSDAGPVTVSLAGRTATIVGGEWFCDVALTDGENVLVATAVDAAGNSAIATGLVLLDRTPPTATFWLDVDGAKVDPLAGDVITRADEVGIDLWLDEVCAVGVGDEEPVVYPAGSSTFTIALAEGPNDLRFVLTDQAGNGAAPTMFRVTVDTVAPALALADTDPVRTRDPTLVVRGTSEVGCHVTVEGVVAEVLGDGGFTAVVQLAEGFNRIKVAAVDAAGNRAERDLVAEREVVASEGGAWDARSQGILIGIIIGILCALAAAWISMRRQRAVPSPGQGPPRAGHPQDAGQAGAEPDDTLERGGSSVRVVRRGR